MALLVNPYHKPESLLKLNPRGLVPTLQTDDQPLYESSIINEFLEEAYPDHSPHLMPKDLYKKARVRIWSDYVTSRIIPAYHRFLQYKPKDGETKEQAAEQLDVYRQELLGHLKAWIKEADPEGPWFYGADMTMADVTLAPHAV
jgi:glutathione S-transferase